MQHTRRSGIILGCLALAVLVGAALTAPPAQAASGVGPYYAEPAWDQKIPADPRFLILTNWGSQAVLDQETGLVWERTPRSTLYRWAEARSACANQRTIGTRKGWRLPSVHELQSLMVHSAAAPALPPGHPFNIVSTDYWSATSVADVPANAWFAGFSTGDMGNGDKFNSGRVWCVRGGMHNADKY